MEKEARRISTAALKVALGYPCRLVLGARGRGEFKNQVSTVSKTCMKRENSR